MSKCKRRLREPKVGQTWSWICDGWYRIKVKIERIEGEGRERRAFGTSAIGRSISVRAGTLAVGSRAAWLEVDEKGRGFERRSAVNVPRLATQEEGRSASELIHEYAPKGALTLRVCERKAAELRAKGMPRAEVARRYKVTEGIIDRWVRKVREAAEDVQNLAGTG